MSQLVNVRTCMCFAFCSSVACEQHVTDLYLDLVSVRVCVCFAICSSVACEQHVTDLYLDHISAGECVHLRVLCFLLFTGL